jgi:hypothetical protein
VWFDELPKNVSLKNRGATETLKVGEENWYWFKNDWKLDLEIETDAEVPVVISFSYRSLSGANNDTVDKLPLEQKRNYVLQHEGSFSKISKMNLEFTLATLARATNSPASSPSPRTEASPQGIPFQQAESSWFVYLIDEHPEVGLLVLLILVVFIIISWVSSSFVLRFVREWKNRGPKRPKEVQKRGPSELDSLDMQHQISSLSEEAGAKQSYKPKAGKITRYVAGEEFTSAAKSERTPEERTLHPQAGDVFYPNKTEQTRPTFPQPASNSFEQDRKKLETLIDTRAQELRRELNQKASRDEQGRLIAAASEEVDSKLSRITHNLKEQLSVTRKELEAVVLEQASLMDEKREEISRQVANANAKGEKIEQQLEGMLTEFKEMEQRLKDRLAELKAAIGQPDAFYVKTVGAVLGENVEALQDGNFEKSMGERLNQFFHTGVGRADGLQDLRARVDSINAAMKEVAAIVGKLNAKAYDEIRPRLREAEKLVTDLSGMQSELQDRRTVLHVPVSLHAGARETFLDGLGRGIKREIEKLDDPESYFEGELERLITADLITIVDICDRSVAKPPGSGKELESALQELFNQAGLRAILPSRGEPFKTAEQDLLQMTQGGPSLTVALVETRGFYYKHRDKETLLRKAGVMVYR